MNGYVLTRQARSDLFAIWEYIAHDSVDAADRVILEIESACEKLADMPGMGHQRSDVGDPHLRFWLVHSYLIAYDPDTHPLQILRVVSGYRKLKPLFE